VRYRTEPSVVRLITRCPVLPRPSVHGTSPGCLSWLYESPATPDLPLMIPELPANQRVVCWRARFTNSHSSLDLVLLCHTRDTGSDAWGAEFACSLCRLTGITQNLSTAFHPHTDGQTERVNSILEQYPGNYSVGMPTHFVHPKLRTRRVWNLLDFLDTWVAGGLGLGVGLGLPQAPQSPCEFVSVCVSLCLWAMCGPP
jgi:hypothetical protein